MSSKEFLLLCGAFRSFLKQVQIGSHAFYGETTGMKASECIDDSRCLGRGSPMTTLRISRHWCEEINLLVIAKGGLRQATQFGHLLNRERFRIVSGEYIFF